ncbi:MAG: transcription elongation factor GreA [Calditrichaeota bacterium]|nr:transcription elongation factor GreA [Calditrichota bacterium]MCB9366565.1 transcription elongation factor GreA [Calditrichota bacterium]MCB9391177.1 transcription elongation factor GreA [Calditrichota bacterium]
MDKHYLSKSGMEKLQADLNDWKYVKRPAMVKQLQIAREHGDLSENAEYHAAKEELARIDSKIHQLEATMNSAVMIDSSKIVADKVRLLTRVRVRDEKKKSEREFTIVSAAEANPAEGRISHQSPIGQGLMGSKIGDKVEISIPAGVVEWTILDIFPLE